MSLPKYSVKTQTLQKALAKTVAKTYCQVNGYSVQKLMQQRVRIVSDKAYFLQPSGVTPNGLVNDMATKPFPTLVIEVGDGEQALVVPTEYTERFLK